MPQLPYEEWRALVLGPKRHAYEKDLAPLYKRDMLPYAAEMHLRQHRQFHRKPGYGEKKAVNPRNAPERRHTLSFDQVQLRMAKGLLAGVNSMEHHRMEQATLTFWRSSQTAARQLVQILAARVKASRPKRTI